MGSGNRARSALPLLARFARRFEATEWHLSGSATPSLVLNQGSDGRRDHLSTPPTAMATPTPTPTTPTPPPRANPLLLPLPELARRAYASSSASASGREHPRPQEQEAQKDHQSPQQRPPPPTPTPSPPLHRRLLPQALVPYAELMRLEKPVGSWLLAWPGLWSIALAASPGHLPDPYLSLLFAGGAVLLRGTGCTINDLLDRRIDARVERTRTRPLPSGAVTPLQALGFVGLQLSLGLVILAQLNGAAQALGALSLALVGCYPLMKRVTWWPQAFLGLTINWGALMGAAAASPEATAAAPPALQLTAKALSAAATDPSAFFAAAGGNATAALGAFAATPALLPAAALYGSGIAWTLVYDTIYAHQDIRDDRRVGVKSTARLFAERGVSKPALAFFAAAQSALLATAGVLAGAGPAYFAGAAAAGGHVAWQVASVDLSNGEDCARKFAANKWTGALVWGGIVLDRLLAAAGAPLVGG